MPKNGILSDYDLQANAEPAAKKPSVCVGCGTSPVRYQWSDYSGEGMCTRCGVPYQLKWGSDEQVQEGAYPYLNLKDEWVPVVRRYFTETQRFTYLGRMLGGSPPGLREFDEWVETNNAAPEASSDIRVEKAE